MIIAAAAWLPLILAVIEIVARKQEEKGGAAYSPVPYIVLGAAFLGLQTLAGHVEITYYTLMVMAFYAAWRLIGLGLRLRQWRPPLRLAVWLALMIVLGLALGAAQLIPLYELVSQSFREGAASLQQVRDWAWPCRQIITFLLPDFFGNPTAHSYFDIWQRAWVPGDAERAGRTAEHDRLGREELRRRRQLPGAADVAAGRGGRGRCAVAAMATGPRSRGEEERRSRRRRRSRRPPVLPRLDSAAASLCSSSWRCCRCSSPSARRSMRCSTICCPATASSTRRFAGCSPTR